MAEEALVSLNVQRGAELIRALDRAGFLVSAAMWLFDSDVGSWRLLLATPKAGAMLEAYGEIRRIAEAAGLERPDLATISLVPPSDPIVAALSKEFRMEGIGGERLSKNMVGGIYLEDAYIYRAAA